MLQLVQQMIKLTERQKKILGFITENTTTGVSPVLEFINKNKTVLDNTKNAFFSVNLVARKPERALPETNPYFIKFLNEIDWIPNKSAVFAGKLDYQKYSITDRLMIQLIMWMTKGPTNSKTKIEYTDWDKVNEFGVFLNNM